MKVSYNDIKQLTGLDVPVEKMVERIGLRLGEVESVENLHDMYKDAVIVKVETCEPHPDADKLSVCMINAGEQYKNLHVKHSNYIQVVCGAPNVKAGMYAVWLPPGSTVPVTASDEQPFVLEAREIRGQLSNGMLASLKELAIGDSHDGILELHKAESLHSNQQTSEKTQDIQGYTRAANFEAGDSFAEKFGLNDYIIDIENKMFTHRPDCFGVMGVAREVAGIFGVLFENPDWYWRLPSLTAGGSLPLEVSNEASELVPRFTAVVMDNVNVGPSTLEMQIALSKAGIKSINNVVDTSNYVMHMSGQPTHAFDYDKLAERSAGSPTLTARMAKKGEKITLLGQKEVDLSGDEVVISTDKEAVALAGVMGGADTEVSNKTRAIVIECATFNMYNIRRTSMKHGLFTDAVTRYNKGQSPLQNDRILAYISDLMGDTAGARVASQYYDERAFDADMFDRQSLCKAVSVDAEFINSRLGSSLDAQQIATLLRNVSFAVIEDGQQLSVTAPFWRTDIEIAEDIVEEVGRLSGYETLPYQLPGRSTKPVQLDSLLRAKTAIRNSLSALGGNEVLTYSFVHTDLLKKASQDPANSYGISNALSPDLHYYRQSLTPSLLALVHQNVKAKYSEFTLFEIAKTHNKVHGLDATGVPAEIEVTALVTTSTDKKQSAAFFDAKQYLTQLAASFGASLAFEPVPADADYPIISSYERERSALASIKGGEFLGIVGEFKPSVAANFKLPLHTAGFEVDTAALAGFAAESPYQEQSKFPGSDQDLTVQTSSAVNYSALEQSITEVLVSSGYMYNLRPLSIFSPAPGKTNTSFRITVSSLEKTLTTDEVSELIADITAKLEQDYKAVKV